MGITGLAGARVFVVECSDTLYNAVGIVVLALNAARY